MNLPPYLQAIVAGLSLMSGQLWAGQPIDSQALSRIQAFLEAYRTLSEAGSPEFYELYSERAAIYVQKDSLSSTQSFQGASYKNWGRELLATGLARPDASRFQEVTVEQRGSRFLIHAHRYSIVRCYWDLNYVMTLAQDGDSYHIVEEHLTMNPSRACSSANASPVLALAEPKPQVIASARSWHPIDTGLLAATALKLAQQSAASRETVSPTGLVGAVPSKAPTQPDRSPSTLWVQP